MILDSNNNTEGTEADSEGKIPYWSHPVHQHLLLNPFTYKLANLHITL